MKRANFWQSLIPLFFFTSTLHATPAPVPVSAKLGAKIECIKCKFKNGDFKALDMQGSRLLFIDFTETDLKGANLTGVDLRFGELNKTIFDEANLEHSNMAGARARRASFRHANLEGASLTYADLYRCNFTEANLKGADLTGTNLISADFTDADLSGADLTGARIAEAKLKKAKLCETRMPDGVKNPDCEHHAQELPPPADFTPALHIPPRPSHAPTGSAFLNDTRDMTLAAREEAILAQLQSGNVPDFVRKLKPITISSRHEGILHQATLWVTPDYLAIGSDDDFMRIPLGGPTAQKIAAQYGARLPTSRLVDDIYLQADFQAKPIFFPWGKIMRSTEYFIRHQHAIESALSKQDHRPLLLAGHKKDVIISNLLEDIPRRVAIYGWHERHGLPVQPVSITHQNIYADYSHGVRLIADTILLDGKPVALAKVMADPVLSELVSDEGPIVNPDIYLAQIHHGSPRRR